ncbi:MAG: ATP-binding protein [Gammaproteobacteria bacterium]|nr:ATP-binding protein [Gammaproteobacteria bacterium]
MSIKVKLFLCFICFSVLAMSANVASYLLLSDIESSRLMLYIIIISFVASLILALFFSYIMSKPISLLKKNVENINLKDKIIFLDSDVTNFTGEIGVLAKSFNHFISKLRLYTQEHQLLLDVTNILNEKNKFEDSLQSCLETICKAFEWPIGHAYFPVREDNDDIFVSSNIWYLSDKEKFYNFYSLTMETPLNIKVGTPGHIFKQGEPAWVDEWNNSERILKNNVYGALGLPIKINGMIVAILEFFSYKPINDTETLFPFFKVLSAQLSHVFEQQKIQKSFQLAEESRRALADRTLYEKKLKRILSSLRKSNAELEQFAYVASHDLRAPLRGIANIAGWLEEDLDGSLSEKSKKYFEALKVRVQRLDALVMGILDYSRAGATNKKKTLVDINQLLSEIINNASSSKNVKIIIDNTMPVMLANKTAITQVFLNLINNAIQHHDKPAINIHVGYEKQNTFYKFYVSDDGPGIDPRYHEKIFEMFQTLDSRDTQESTGIGLTITKKIIEQAGGNIWLKSDLGKGSTFYFTWKVSKPIIEHHDEKEYELQV